MARADSPRPSSCFARGAAVGVRRTRVVCSGNQIRLSHRHRAEDSPRSQSVMTATDDQLDLHPPPASASVVGNDTLIANIIAALRTVHDPEIPVNIYDLGLIYRIETKH